MALRERGRQLVSTAREKAGWIRTVLRRLIWGGQEVGFFRAIAGLATLVSLAVWRPSRTEVRTTTTRLRIAFNYPTQLMPLLVVFQEMLDPELTMLHTLLGPGRIALDVGASIGTWALCAAKTGAVVYACEPDSENFSMLKENIVLNGFESSVLIYDFALGAGEGWSSTSQRGRRYLTNVRLATDPTETNGKRIFSLDQFVRSAGIEHVDVLKINTAGCEADVLAGCAELFSKERVGVAMFLDGLTIRPLLDGLKQFSYELGFYDQRRRAFISVETSSQLDGARPGPMNRYVLAKHSSVII